MTMLIITYNDTSYGRISNCMLRWRLEPEADFIYGGYRTLSMQGLWKLFVEGKVILGSPFHIAVSLNEQETKVFKLITKAGWDRKRSIWMRFLNGDISRNALLNKLEEELPVWVLKQKLSNERK